MAQQARPKVAGQRLPLRASPANCSTVVSRNPLGSFSSRPMSRLLLRSVPLASVPLQTSAAPDVGVGDEDREDEQHHLGQSEPAEGVEGHGPGIEKDDLDVEDDEE